MLMGGGRGEYSIVGQPEAAAAAPAAVVGSCCVPDLSLNYTTTKRTIRNKSSDRNEQIGLHGKVGGTSE